MGLKRSAQISSILALLLFGEGLHGAVYTVDLNSDTGASSGMFSGDLRYCLDQLNMGAGGAGSTIIFSLMPGFETITLASALPHINAANTDLIGIDGANTFIGAAPLITIEGFNSMMNTNFPGFIVDQVFDLAAPGLTIQNIIMQNCHQVGADGMAPLMPGQPGLGGSLLAFAFPLNPTHILFSNVQITGSLAQGGDGNQADGGNAQGGAVWSSVPIIIQTTMGGISSFSGAIQPGIPTPVPNNSFGPTLVSANPSAATQINAAAGTTISFTDSFVLTSPLELNGPGTVSLTTTDFNPPSGDFLDSYYITFGAIDVNMGTLHLDGQVTQLPSGALLPLPIFGSAFGDLTIAAGATLSGTGLILAAVGSQTVVQGGSIAPSLGGTLFFLGDVDFQAGTQMFTQVSPTQTASISLSAFDVTGPAIDISNVTLNVDIQAGSYTTPTVYALVLSQQAFSGTFSNINVTYGMPGPDPSNSAVVYSPLSLPNSILFPVNVPYGISNVNIVLGSITLTSTVLYDPCAGIIVVNLLAPGSGAASLSAFFANQSVLTAQTLGSLTASLNAQCLKRSAGGVSNVPATIAKWNETKSRLLVQSSADTVPKPRRAPEENQEEKRKFLPTILPAPKQTPNYSISFTPLGLFQHQDTIETSTAVLPTYGTKTWGAILGCDYLGMENILIGGATTFAWTDLTVADGGGSQKTWSLFATAYSSFTLGHFFFNLLATGSYNHNNAIRNFVPIAGDTLSIESASPFGTRTVYTFQSTGIPGGTAFSAYSTYQIVPHVDFNYEIGFGYISLVPFLLSDCSFSFAGSIVESGDSVLNSSACLNPISLNTATDSLTTIIIQSEAGANLFEQVELNDTMTLIFRQKGSYVNRYTVPYTLRSKLIDSTEFTKTSISLPLQHMFGASAEMVYQWGNFSTVLTYEGIYGSGFLSNAGYLRFGYSF